MKKKPNPKPASERIAELKKGATGINEAARILLDINRDEYAFCQYVHYRQGHPSQKRRGFCADKKDEVAQFVGISRQALYKMIDRMEVLGLMTTEANGDLSTTALFIDTEVKCKESLHDQINGVNLVDKDCKESLQQDEETVNLVARNNKVLDRVNKKEEKEKNGEAVLKPKFKFDFPDKYWRFTDPEAIAALWKRWVDYRKDRKPAIKTEDEAFTALKKLYEWTKGDVAACTRIVESSIANGWQGLFEPKAPITEKPKNQPPPTVYTTPNYFNPDKYKRT